MSRASQHLRVVALGDSLTVGFQSYEAPDENGALTPYTEFLADHVKGEFSSEQVSVEIVNKGIVGELSEQMLARFNLDVIDLSPDVVIILGGSNDLGWGLTPVQVFQNLSEMYRLALENQVTPVACTIPSILGFDGGIPPRIALNRLVQEHCMALGLRCADVFRATIDHVTNRLALRYSSDGLHLNSEGYSKMGEVIYVEGLRPILNSMVGREVSNSAT